MVIYLVIVYLLMLHCSSYCKTNFETGLPIAIKVIHQYFDPNNSRIVQRLIHSNTSDYKTRNVLDLISSGFIIGLEESDFKIIKDNV